MSRNTNGIKHILFATDGSEYSSGAQRLAIELANRCGAELTAMTVVLSMEDLEGVGTHHLRETLEKEAQDRLAAVVAACRSEGVPCATRVAYGEAPEQEIIATAAEIGADLICLGRRGKRGLARFMVGHATAHVAGRAPCDVLVVPRAAEMWRQRVLLATDGSPPSEAAARVAASMAGQCALPVSVVSATKASHSTERKAEARAVVDRTVAALDRAGIASDGAVAEGRADAVVVETATSCGADLIVMGSHGRSGLPRILLGSISERVIGQARCPVLVAHTTG